jgi:hypothetical protein
MTLHTTYPPGTTGLHQSFFLDWGLYFFWK